MIEASKPITALQCEGTIKYQIPEVDTASHIVCKDRFVVIWLEGEPTTVDATAFSKMCRSAFPGCTVTLRTNGRPILQRTP